MYIDLYNSIFNDDLKSFQNGVDKIYNKCKASGSTPSTKTPDAICTSIQSIYDKAKSYDSIISSMPALNSYLNCKGLNIPVSGGTCNFNSYTDYSKTSDGSYTVFKAGTYEIYLYIAGAGAIGYGNAYLRLYINNEIKASTSAVNGERGETSKTVTFNLSVGDKIKIVSVYSGSSYDYFNGGNSYIKPKS